MALSCLLLRVRKIAKGDRLTEGSLNPHDVLRISGVKATQNYLVSQVVGVYKSQGRRYQQ